MTAPSDVVIAHVPGVLHGGGCSRRAGRMLDATSNQTTFPAGS
nr:hypothetical protein OH826_29560 [Streptomyces sp. NBC_00899]